MFDIITIGACTEDIVFPTNQGVLVSNQKNILQQKLIGFEYGAKIKIEQAQYFFGGGASNTAVSFASLGLKTACLSIIGDDQRGEKIIENLKNKKINYSLIQKVKNKKSSWSFLLINSIKKEKEHVAFVSQEVNNYLQINNQHLKILAKTKNIHINSLSGDWENNLNKIFSLNNINISWNPGLTQLKTGSRKLNKYLKKTNVLILNKDEALELVLSEKVYQKKSKKFLNNPENLLKIIQKYGSRIIVITQGNQGAYCIDNHNKIYFSPAQKIKKLADTTGVGDGFSAGFVSGLIFYQNNIKKALKLGIKNSASIVKKVGAQNGILKN